MSEGLGRFFSVVMLSILTLILGLITTSTRVSEGNQSRVLLSIFPVTGHLGTALAPVESGPSRPQVFIVVGAVPGVSGSPPCAPGGPSESMVTQRVAEALAKRLNKTQVHVILFGGSARNARPLTALRGARTDAVLILHTAGCDPNQSGFHICSWHGHEVTSPSNQLARRLHEAYGNELHGRIAPSLALLPWERENHILLHPDTSVHLSTPAVVVELGSLRHDGGVLQSSAGVESMATGLAKGVCQFLVDRKLLPSDQPSPGSLTWEEQGAIRVEQNALPISQGVLAAIQPAAIQPTSTAASPAPPGLAMVRHVEQGVPFQLVHSVTGQPLAAPVGSTPNCQALQSMQATLDESLWILQPTGAHYRIVHRSSRRHLDAAPAEAPNSAAVMLCAPNLTEGQSWQFRASGNQVQLVAQHGGGHLEFIAGAVVQSQPSGDSSQRWILQPVYPAR
jgi:N-acetylmuramoyl-L-alanine amidase